MKYTVSIFCAFIVILAFAQPASAQLYMNSIGNVGINTTSPWYPLHVQGKGYFREGNCVLRLFPSNPGVEIGSSTDRIDFWYSNTGHNKLKAEQFNKTSDASLKENIEPLDSGLSVIMQLQPKRYNLIESEDSLRRLEFGFLAQDILQVLPNLVSYGKDSVKLLDYDQLIAYLVVAIQEQQTIIDSLCSPAFGKRDADSRSLESAASYLEQNSPNPFRENTVIRFSVAQEATRASIMVFDLNGTLLQSYPIKSTGLGEIVIEGRALKAGMYIYTLVVDGQEVDSKKMILSK